MKISNERNHIRETMNKELEELRENPFLAEQVMQKATRAGSRQRTNVWKRTLWSGASILAVVVAVWMLLIVPRSDPQNAEITPTEMPEVMVAVSEQNEASSLRFSEISACFEQQESKLDVISLIADPNDLWNAETGILAEGEEIDKTNPVYQNATYQRMKGTSISAHMDYLVRDISGGHSIVTLRFSDEIMISLTGDDTNTVFPQKSLLLTAANGAMTYHFFPEREQQEYASLVLSTGGGQDCIRTRLADTLQSRLIEKYLDTKLMTLAWKPVAVYLNGEYWGQYDLRENVDAETICRREYLPSVLASDVKIVTANTSTRSEDYAAWTLLTQRIKQLDPEQSAEDLNELVSLVDVDSFLDWLAVKVYFGDSGIWPVYYQISGGQWKCLGQGFDWGLYNSSYNAIESYLNPKGMKMGLLDNTVFRKLLDVDEIKERFLQKLGEIYQRLTTEVMQAELDDCVAEIDTDVKSNWLRWEEEFRQEPAFQQSASDATEDLYTYWHKYVDRMRNGTMEKRPAAFYAQIQAYFNLSDDEMEQYFDSNMS